MSEYEFITTKIQTLKTQYPSLRDKNDDYVFNALVVKSMFYKNPAYELTDSDFDEIIVDGTGDGGADVLLADPDSETSDMIIGQAKYYKNIDTEHCRAAIDKMANFYIEMSHGHYENVNPKVQRRYLSLDGDVGDESKIKFVLFVSAPKKRISVDRLKSLFYSKLTDHNKYELLVLFDKDIVEEIYEAESRRPLVESGSIVIDNSDNCLVYGNLATMVNVSAFSIKKLYSEHHTNLLARNLRYHVPGTAVDRAIEDSINNNPEYFWLKNNGITIICDDFVFDGNKVVLTNFSIINGGQTTYKLSRNRNLSEEYDLFLPCKIVRVIGDTEDEKANFILEIAKATNSQKAIKPADLRANAPEQIRFCAAMRDVGVFYQTKRGEEIPSSYKAKIVHSDLAEIGKLCLSGVFQMPGTSRNKPSDLYLDQYYETIFNGNQQLIAKLCRELLYIDYYFKNTFISQYTKKIAQKPNSDIKVQFANNARTVCTAFVVFASRYYQGNLSDESLNKIFNAAKDDALSDDRDVYDIVRNLDGVSWILPPTISGDKEKYNSALFELFDLIIKLGTRVLSTMMVNNDSINASNFLKKDKNYIDILRINWDDISEEITDIFERLESSSNTED